MPLKTKTSWKSRLKARRNKPKIGTNPLRQDPTRTTTLRRAFVTELYKRFARLKGKIVKLISGEDALGLEKLVGTRNVSTVAELDNPITLNILSSPYTLSWEERQGIGPLVGNANPYHDEKGRFTSPFGSYHDELKTEADRLEREVLKTRSKIIEKYGSSITSWPKNELKELRRISKLAEDTRSDALIAKHVYTFLKDQGFTEETIHDYLSSEHGDFVDRYDYKPPTTENLFLVTHGGPGSDPLVENSNPNHDEMGRFASSPFGQLHGKLHNELEQLRTDYDNLLASRRGHATAELAKALQVKINALGSQRHKAKDRAEAAKEAWKDLKALGYDKDTIQDITEAHIVGIKRGIAATLGRHDPEHDDVTSLANDVLDHYDYDPNNRVHNELVTHGENCGTGAGGFQPGNTCGKGGGSGEGGDRSILPPNPKTPTDVKVEIPFHLPPRTIAITKDAVNQFLGGDIQKAAGLVGAQPGANIRLSAWGRGQLIIEVDHPKYHAARTIREDDDGSKIMENESFSLMRDVPKGTGIGLQVFSDQVEHLRAEGFKYIKLNAARGTTMNGHYSWARMGCDAKVVDINRESVRNAVTDRFPKAIHISDLMTTKADRDWWKENGGSVEMKFDLTEGSRSLRILYAYQDEMRKERGGKLTKNVDEPIHNEPNEQGEEIELTPEDEDALDKAWEKVIEEEKRRKEKDTTDNLDQLVTHGGPRSGNFGHPGRPGQVGGSGSGGSGSEPPRGKMSHPVGKVLLKSLKGASNLSAETKGQVVRVVHHVLSSLPKTALDRASDNGLKQVTFHEKSSDCTSAWVSKAMDITGGKSGEPPDLATVTHIMSSMLTGVHGFMDQTTGTLHANGETELRRLGTLAHEMMHAVDGTGPKALSNSQKWMEASNKEIMGEGYPKLTEYARTNQAEAFAEFGRLVHGSKGVTTEGLDATHNNIEKNFPLCTGFLKENGLWTDKEDRWPRQVSKRPTRNSEGQILPELFNHREEGTDGSHADCWIPSFSQGTPTGNTRWADLTDAERVEAFQDWLAEQFDEEGITGLSGEELWERFTTEGFKRGQGRAFDDLSKSQLAGAINDRDKTMFYQGNREQFLRSSFGQPVATEKVKLLAGRSFDELEGLTNEMGLKMSRVLTDGLVTGANPRDIAKGLVDQVDLSRVRAERIAQHECFLPETLVDAAMVRAVFRRWYEGPVCEIETSSGRKFTATPNHPMLTQLGWVATGILEEGDYLVRYVGQKDLGSGDPDVQRHPTPIGEVFNTLRAVGTLERVVGSKPDFHGDGLESEVEILRPNVELPIGVFTSLNQPAVEKVFPPTGHTTVLGLCFCGICSHLLPVDQSVCFVCGAEGNTSLIQTPFDRITVGVEIGGELTERLSGQVASHDLVGVQVGTELVGNSTLFPCKTLSLRESSSSSGLTNEICDPSLVVSGLFSDIPSAHPRDVELDQVTLVRVRQFSGHVYNLETSFGYYLAEGYYTGNCIRAHNEGQLMALEQLGVDEVGVMVEWLATPDDRVCPQCEMMQGVVLTIDEAKGVLPAHVGCRCCWLPANVGESKKDQIRGKEDIDDTMDEAYDEDEYTPDIDEERPEDQVGELMGDEEDEEDDDLAVNTWLVTHGGPTSGDWGHPGRPGQVGGSAPGGGGPTSEQVKAVHNPETGKASAVKALKETGLEAHIKSGKLATKKLVEAAAKVVHDEWVRREKSLPGGGREERKHLHVPYDKLSEAEKDKDRMFVRDEAAKLHPKEHWGSPKQPYWRPGINPTVDNVITRDGRQGPEVLLIRRADREGVTERGKWALPGGFHDSDAKKGETWKPGKETAKEAALRELKEETGLGVEELQSRLKEVGTYEGKGRDPRDNEEAWSHSTAYQLHLPPEQAVKSVSGTDDADQAKWVPTSELKGMDLAFDHGKILQDAGITDTKKLPYGLKELPKPVPEVAQPLPKKEAAKFALASPKEIGQVKHLVAQKTKDAPVPSKKELKKMTEALEKAKMYTRKAKAIKDTVGVGKTKAEVTALTKQLIGPRPRTAGESKGNSKDRAKRAQNLFTEFGGDYRGYVVCHISGIKMHHTDDPKENPHGYPKFEQSKIFVTKQGGGSQLSNLIPEARAANRSRNASKVRKENQTENATTFITHGGPRSGNFGHPGRPGQVGGSGEGGGKVSHEASPKELRAAKWYVKNKVKNAPVPKPEKVTKMRAALAAAREYARKYEEIRTSKAAEGKNRDEIKALATKQLGPPPRAGGEARGNSNDRRQRAKSLFKEFGGDDKGYVVCHVTGLKMHYTDDPEKNPNGYPKFEQGKVFTAHQGGGYQLPNLIPESYAANRTRNDKPVRKENLD